MGGSVGKIVGAVTFGVPGAIIGHSYDKQTAAAKKAAKAQAAAANAQINAQKNAEANAKAEATAQRRALIANQSKTNYTTALGDTDTEGTTKKKTLLGA